MRSAGWQIRLSAWAASRLGSPFIWGEIDCALICFEAVDCLTRGALAIEYRNRWRSGRQALKFQARERLNLETALSNAGIFRWSGIPIFGDLILHPHPANAFVCGHVCLGELSMGANESSGVYAARTSDVCSQAGAFVMRVA